MKKHRLIPALAGALLLAVSCPALAGDFDFSVPVDVQNLPPEITRATVCCDVMTAERGGTNLGNNCSAPLPISGGAISGTYPVSVDVAPGVDPSTGRFYVCAASFFGTIRGIETYFTPRNWRYNASAPRIPYTVDEAVVSGPIP
jgi:hypothetical protein